MTAEARGTSALYEVNPEPYLEMVGIEKGFGPIQALRGVDFEVRAGEIMALVGENGAGKSTLVKILTGIYRPDHGVIRIGGRPVTIHGPADSLGAGIAVVQQELSLVPTMSVVENVLLCNPSRGALFSPGKLRELARPFLELVGLSDVDLGIPIGQLPVADRQLIEIARMLSRRARILILDEPTAALSDAEIERVKNVVRSLAADGRSVIYVTHRLQEVFDLANRVTVFRNGDAQPAVSVKELTVETLIERMIGQHLGDMFPPKAAAFGAELLAVDGLLARGLRQPITLRVRAGEILGLTGQIGSGAASMLQAIAGVHPILEGSVQLGGKPLKIEGRRDAIAARIAYCSADRKQDGLFQVRTITQNLTAPALDRVTPFGWLSVGREKTLAGSLAGMFQIDARRLGHLANTLSGGNQQKVALGKWLGIEPAVLLVEEPTRGVDVGARAEIYAHLRKLAARGLAVVFASSDVQEVLGLADTIASFYKGRLVNLRPAADTDVVRVTQDVTCPPDERVEVR
ncbi:MAG: sugar ABC transporter ATP-binding protein [Chloroflexi bacterium]|nr:sugar ABC transporter ATP-binding protein [Chloroflexota bacterium]